MEKPVLFPPRVGSGDSSRGPYSSFAVAVWCFFLYGHTASIRVRPDHGKVNSARGVAGLLFGAVACYCARLPRTKPSSDRRWGNVVSLWGESASGKEAEKRNNYSSININLLPGASIWMVFAKRL